jgi:hypothetical protein
MRPLRTKFYALTMPRSVLTDAINEGRKSRHESVFSYRIQNVDDAAWSQVSEELAPALAAVPGLIRKIWLHGEGSARGGVYLWEEKAAYEAFLASDLGKAVGSHPNITDLTICDYSVDEAPSMITRGAPGSTADNFLRLGVPDDQVSTEICADEFLDAKIAALKAHDTQVLVDEPFFEAAGLFRMRALGTEYYTLLSYSCAMTSDSGGRGREDDLF